MPHHLPRPAPTFSIGYEAELKTTLGLILIESICHERLINLSNFNFDLLKVKNSVKI